MSQAEPETEDIPQWMVDLIRRASTFNAAIQELDRLQILRERVAAIPARDLIKNTSIGK